MILEIEENPNLWIVDLDPAGIIPMDTNNALQFLVRAITEALEDTNNLSRLLELNIDISLISRRNGLLASQYISRLFHDRLLRRIRQLQERANALENLENLHQDFQNQAPIFRTEDDQEEELFDPHRCHAFCFCKGKI
ncbi:hypothetical protein [Angelica bushy stunt virus]|uniref:Uncharacterized protein n=1 Tax=Angelica bushy stunt virus TaxID=1808970 RepID=A0A140GL64_9VIRU|nr:hypothetical protein [Angelica bushy stunt virus]AMN10082.1 hypothetical protein [Angelica bushy stunt virus]